MTHDLAYSPQMVAALQRPEKDGPLTSPTDPRMDSYPLMSSPFPTLAICLTYVITVSWLGPRWMKNRQPYDVRKLLIVYNFAQVLFSLFLFYRVGRRGGCCLPNALLRDDCVLISRMLNGCFGELCREM